MATIEVKSDITGTVCQIIAGAGDRLQAGDTILVVESMKMEIPVSAPASGLLSKICIAVDTAVSEGDVLAVLES